jgi:hypothetical protein
MVRRNGSTPYLHWLPVSALSQTCRDLLVTLQGVRKQTNPAVQNIPLKSCWLFKWLRRHWANGLIRFSMNFTKNSHWILS